MASTAATVEALARLIDLHRPDVILVDLALVGREPNLVLSLLPRRQRLVFRIAGPHLRKAPRTGKAKNDQQLRNVLVEILMRNSQKQRSPLHTRRRNRRQQALGDARVRCIAEANPSDRMHTR